jgi:hypothetical protein
LNAHCNTVDPIDHFPTMVMTAEFGKIPEKDALLITARHSS